MLKPLQQVLREHVTDMHSRGCIHRQVGCSCGYDDNTQKYLKQAANRIDDLEAEVSALKLTLKTV